MAIVFQTYGLAKKLKNILKSLCHETFGRMYDDMTWSGKWYGAQLPFQSGGVEVNRQIVFMFRDDKLYTMFKVMFPE